MPINREEYDNPEVNRAKNPSSYGYHHGPVHNPNINWAPDHENATAKMSSSAPNPGASLSKVNGRVCHIAVNGNEMCGFQSDNTPAYWRYLRITHPGSAQNPSRRNVPQAEFSAGENSGFAPRAGAMRDSFENLGRGPADGLIDQYASEMELLSQEDREFARAFGTRFHCSRVNANTPGLNKRKRGPTPPVSPPPSPNRSYQRRGPHLCRSERAEAIYVDE